MNASIHEFTVKNLAGKEVDLKKYEGKVLLIVNTASKCGFTPQYEQLEELYKSLKDRGLEILAFPSDDFGGQEPLGNEEIQEFCQVNYGVSFTVLEKTVVKGKNVSPLFQFLSQKKLNGNVNSVPKWNFHKYLVNKEGEVVDYFYTLTLPTSSKIKKAIEKLL